METGGRYWTAQDVEYLELNVKELTGALASFAGDEWPFDTPVIISGVRFTDNSPGITATPGWIHFQGEIYQFIPPTSPINQSGLSNVKLYRTAEVDQALKYKDTGEIKDIHFKRCIKLDTSNAVDANTALLPADRISLSTLKRARKNCAGEIIAFSPRAGKPFSYYCDIASGLGINGMEGKALCDGRNGTPNLQGRFIVGLSTDGLTVDNVKTPTEYDGIGKTGGERLHQLSIAEFPEHDHGGQTGDPDTNLNHNHNQDKAGFSPSNSGTGIYLSVENIGGSHWGLNNSTIPTGDVNGGNSQLNHKHSIAKQGSGNFHENRPPYYVLAYFQVIGDEDVLTG